MQVTVRKQSLKNKSDKMLQKAKEEVADRLISAIDYLEANVEVDTGAYARSMHLNRRGDSSGHGESSHRKERGVDGNAERTAMGDRLYAALEVIDPLEGATFVNNAPHAKYVEIYHAYFDRLKDILR